jgi:hypothetical protein
MNRSPGFFALLLTLLSCSDPEDGGEDGGSAGSASGGSAGSGGSGGATNAGNSGAGTAGSTAGSGGDTALCNAVPANAPEYPQLYSAEPAPAGKGGTIVDGTYFVTSSTWYEAPPGLPDEMLYGIRMEIAGPYWEEAVDWPAEDTVDPNEHFTHYVTSAANAITTTQMCPTHLGPERFEYTAEGDTLTVYVIDGSATFGMAMTRQ